MATAPVKSQPLHNFSLPRWEWGHNNNNNNNNNQINDDHRRRGSPPQTAADYGSDGGSKNEFESENRKLAVGSRTSRNRFSISSCSATQRNQAPALEREGDEADGEREKVGDGFEVEESVVKPWNLRPRKAVTKVAIEIGGAPIPKNGELQESCNAIAAIPAAQQTENLPKSLRLRGFGEGNGGSEKKEKRKFWISLSREEIEEDVYSMTGSKPARRPKKRAKNIQKQLDSVFPGLYLAGITADSYRVHDAQR